MKIHLDQQLTTLKKELSIMHNETMEALVYASRALKNRDKEMATRIIENDKSIDALENKIDGMILAILGLQQPFAIDLRFITASMKLNSDLERIGDKCVSIARAILHIDKSDQIDKEIDAIIEMAKYSLKMLKESFDCFINKNASVAKKVIKNDKKLDEMNKKFYIIIKDLTAKSSKNADLGLQMYRIATSIERIGDLSKNISEDAIYYAKGEQIKHLKI